MRLQNVVYVARKKMMGDCSVFFFFGGGGDGRFLGQVAGAWMNE